MERKMRKPIIAGNWKMNLTRAEALAMLDKLIPAVQNNNSVEIVVCPAYPVLDAVKQKIAKTNVKLGSQNVFYKDSGAYTGAVSPLMLVDIGVEYVIIGHSERRQYFGETDEMVNLRAQTAYQHNLIPIICVGETLDERESGQTEFVVQKQVEGCLNNLPREKMINTVIAYEPVWAIGTGRNATPEQAQEVHSLIRGLLKQLYDEKLAQAVRIQYGGSVKPDNVTELMAMEDIDGALVGGASLKADSFAKIVNYNM